MTVNRHYLRLRRSCIAAAFCQLVRIIWSHRIARRYFNWAGGDGAIARSHDSFEVALEIVSIICIGKNPSPVGTMAKPSNIPTSDCDEWNGISQG